MHKMLAIAAAASAATIQTLAGGKIPVSVWRGETYNLVLPRDAAVGRAPEGVTLKAGTAKAVGYNEVKHGVKKLGPRKTFDDRVEWGAGGKGTRVLAVTAAPDAKPGVYKAGDLEITVVDRVLPPPREWKYFLDLWQHPWAVSRHSGVKPFSKEHFDAMRPVYELLADAGNKTLTVTITDLPWDHQCHDGYYSMIGRVKGADGKWKFDYSVFDRYVEFGRSCGLGPHIACYTMCPWGYKVYWKDAEGGMHSAKAVPGTGEFKDFWGDFLVDFSAHLKSKGWFEDVYVAIDERSPKDVRNISDFIKEKAPGLKIALAGNKPPSEFKGIQIENSCFALRKISDRHIGEAAARRAKGMVTTYYVCCSPEHPNTLAGSPPEEAFWLGVFPAACGLDGFLRWAWNSWPKDPDSDATFAEENGRWWPSGDTYLVYPGAKPSLRFLELRNGIVAAEKMRLLREKGLYKKELDAVSAKFDRNAAIRNKCDFGALKREVQAVVNRRD